MADRLILLLAFVVTCLPARAGESLPDPTRPPTGLGTAPVGGAVGGGVPAEPEKPVLSSVIISVKGAPTAVIGGQVMHVGERLGEQRIVRITETAVVLSGARGQETILLTPAAEKKMRRPAPSADRGKGEKR